MYKSFDFECQSCHNIFDDLINDQDSNPICPSCQSSTIKLFGNRTTSPSDPKMTELMIKGRISYNKMKNSSANERGRNNH